MPTLENALDSLLARHFTRFTPGAVLLVAREDEVLYLRGAGKANLDTGAAITPDTTFRLASVSKQFTAMCVHLLAQRGLLKFTDSIGLYFPELAHFSEIRLLHLLNHTSGLPDFEEHIPENQAAQLTDEHVLRITAAQPALLFSPGNQYRYSNTGYVLLGLLVERVASINYADFLLENIFEPLQMPHSILYQPEAAIPNRAMGYSRAAEDRFELSDQNIGTATRGDGCIYTSAKDYLKWHRSLSSHPLFNINNKLNKNIATIDEAKSWRYGMGWFQAEDGNGTSELFHSGDTSGFTNLVMRLPHHNTVIACFSNIAGNQVFLDDLLQVLSHFPELSPKSELVKQLQQLTR
ncbi:serine hydrolase domain-containing protein [Pontibacter anaerobius]|uniref:Serine hydrolase n=1 Tax=Pontibacter anaerobius TaxID=2993940 RepID=A0ABT3RFX9_9BACT|nr:serine hydrolase domain-containing protein [Pontibacter anaerobius]MCX2740388.1 serine hydrolase [Pontibacter anaerobius]